jgi:hypothetical protein
MRRYIWIPALLMVITLFVACATTWEERKEEHDLRKSVGYSAFVGDVHQSRSGDWRSP